MDRRGLSLIELLIAMSILVVVLVLISFYFVEQADMNRRTQARSEVQDRVRLVMQLVTQDLQLAGASRYVDGSGTVNTSVSIITCPDDPDDATTQTCFKATSGSGGADWRDGFVTVYINSLRDSSNACRKVGYRFAPGTMTLQRADVGCDGTLTPPDAYTDLAGDIVAMDIRYLCSNTNSSNAFPDTSCPSTSAYLRSAEITIVGRSSIEVPGLSQKEITTASGQKVLCGPDYICTALTQEVLMPNLKNN